MIEFLLWALGGIHFFIHLDIMQKIGLLPIRKTQTNVISSALWPFLVIGAALLR